MSEDARDPRLPDPFVCYQLPWLCFSVRPGEKQAMYKIPSLCE